jgi:hypothetical protein
MQISFLMNSSHHPPPAFRSPERDATPCITLIRPRARYHHQHPAGDPTTIGISQFGDFRPTQQNQSFVGLVEPPKKFWSPSGGWRQGLKTAVIGVNDSVGYLTAETSILDTQVHHRASEVDLPFPDADCFRDLVASSASVRATDYSQLDSLGAWCKLINFAAEKNGLVQTDETKSTAS